ncbi:MAG: type II secretion system protein J [Pseudobdellovibrionaceae bacterium]
MSRKSTAGYTFIELAVAIGILAFAGIVIATLISNSTSQFSKLQKNLEVQQQFSAVEAALKKTLKQAVNIRYCAAVPLAIATDGCIRDYTSAHGGALTTLAVFAREIGTRTNQEAGVADTTLVSKFAPTGIFFIPPSSGAPHTSGVLFVDMGANPTSIQAGYGDIFIPGLVSLSVGSFNPGTTAGEKLTSVQFTFVLREFYAAPDTVARIRSWCADGTCPSNAMAYKDHTKIFTVLFRNNEIGNDPFNPTVPTRPLGLLYFFDMKERPR